MINVQGLRKDFAHHRVLNGVNLTVEPGERVAVLGFNGAGKTTLFRCLMGITKFTGSIRVGGADVLRDGKTARALMGYVPQRAPHFEGSLREMVDFFCELRKAPKLDIYDRLERAHVSIEDHGAKAVKALSGGMLQKVLLTIALGAGAKVLVLDEPTANLDPHARRDFLQMLRGVPEDVALLLSSHQLSDVEAVARRVVILEQGDVVFDGQIDDLSGYGLGKALLWISTDPADRTKTIEVLEAFGGVRALKRGNGRIGVQINRRDAAKALGALDAKGIVVHDFSFDTPTVEDLLAKVISEQPSPSSSDVVSDQAVCQ